MIKRRQLLMHSAVAAALLMVGASADASPKTARERTVNIKTAEGEMQTFIVRPRGRGQHPVVVIYMDASGVREELRDMARRLAAKGYYAVLPNFYYRSGVLEIGPEDLSRDSAFWQRTRAALALVSVPKVMADTDSLLAFLATQKEARTTGIGVMGFCVSGPWVIHAAARHPEQIAFAASIHGVYLVTDAPGSPHRLAGEVKSDLYFAFAENDDFVPPTEVEAVAQSVRAKPNALVDVYPGVRHGFAFPLRYAYDKPAAELLLGRLESLFDQRLKHPAAAPFQLPAVPDRGSAARQASPHPDHPPEAHH